MVFVGIDYSITCPCICVSLDKTYLNSYFYFLSDKSSVLGEAFNISGDPHLDYTSDAQRYENISSWVLSILMDYQKQDLYVTIEDYSFGSKGKVFNIAENCGLLKYMLYKNKIAYQTIPPTVIKKYATGKGNANKQQMYDCFYKDHQIDLIDVYSKTGKLDSPVTDIVDSYYIKNYTIDNIGTFNFKPVPKTKKSKKEREDGKLNKR